MKQFFHDWGFAILCLIITLLHGKAGLKAEETQKRKHNLYTAACFFFIAAANVAGLRFHWRLVASLFLAAAFGCMIASLLTRPEEI